MVGDGPTEEDDMAGIFCPSCALEQPITHRYCIRCGGELPSHLLVQRPQKVARWFAGVRIDEGDGDAPYLRVSCYLAEHTVETAEGSVMLPGRHVRFSVWDTDRATCALSLPENEALALAAFISHELAEPDQRLAMSGGTDNGDE